LWQYLRKEPAFQEKGLDGLVNIISFTENFLRLAQIVVTLYFLTMFALLVAITRANKFLKSKLSLKNLRPKLNSIIPYIFTKGLLTKAFFYGHTQ
jgi:hypothetical protein